MKDLQLVKSDYFGTVQCDFYSNGKDYFMTREQIGAALEYSNPIIAISKIHDRHKERLDKYSVITRLVSTDGKAYDTTVYPRKGIMEICRWSQQPGADAFMDWVWNIMDALMSGKAQIVPKHRSLGETNAAARIIISALKDADMPPQYRAVALQSLYEPVGVTIPLDGIKTDKQLFNCTEIAAKLGIMSKAGKPHYQAVAAIIAQLPICDDEKELVPFQSAINGHAGPTLQYAQSVIDKVQGWLIKHNYPAKISVGGKSYKVAYKFKPGIVGNKVPA